MTDEWETQKQFDENEFIEIDEMTIEEINEALEDADVQEEDELRQEYYEGLDK